MALSNGIHLLGNYLACISVVGNGLIEVILPCSNTTAAQWQLTSQGNANSFIFQNLATHNYASWNGTPWAPIVDMQSPMTWYLNQSGSTQGHYWISPNNSYTTTWTAFGSTTVNSTITATNGPQLTLLQVTSNRTGLSITPFKSTEHTKTTSTRVIAGASVAGGVVGIGLLVLAWLQAHHLYYLFSSIGFALFGWMIFGRRTLCFSADKNIGQVEISLFLSSDEVIKDSESLLVWDVVEIGHSRRTFTTHCPVIRGTSDGQTKIGFATVEEEEVNPNVKRFKAVNYHVAPVKWNGSFFDQLDGVDGLVLRIALENGGSTDKALQVSQRFVLGTCDKSSESFKPYLRLGNLQEGDHPTNSNLFLHAIITNGYKHGQYGEKLVENVKKDILNPQGFKIMDLGPITDFHISKTRNEKFELKMISKRKKSNDV